MKTTKSATLTILFALILVLNTMDLYAQGDSETENQLWAMTFLNFKLNNRWVYNQDIAYQHSYKTPTFTRFLVRSQISHQTTGTLSLHGGVNFFYAFVETGENALDLWAWGGTKVRWPYFWRINFVHYVRLEQRFRYAVQEENWDSNFRVRYKISTNVPINNPSISDKTLYGVLAYEFFSVSFGDDIRFTTAATHRFDAGFGFRQNVKNRYEALIVALNGLDKETEQYNLSSLVLFLRYKRYINWNRENKPSSI